MHVRGFWFLVGAAATACGFAGAILPLVPTTPFLLVAVYAFARSSPRLEAWLLGHPHFGRLIRNWRNHRGIDPASKVMAICVMGLALAMTWLLDGPVTVLAVQAAVLAAVAVFVLTRPSAPEA